MTLPITDAVVVQLARIADALEEANDRETRNVDAQVNDIREALEQQYTQRIETLEQRLGQKLGHNFPFTNGPIGLPGRPPSFE